MSPKISSGSNRSSSLSVDLQLLGPFQLCNRSGDAHIRRQQAATQVGHSELERVNRGVGFKNNFRLGDTPGSKCNALFAIPYNSADDTEAFVLFVRLY